MHLPVRAEGAPELYASIDVGSHTIRLLIARLEEGRMLCPLCTERRITRLAADFQDGETLKAVGIRKSLEALKEYRQILDRYEVCFVASGATGVVRRARNSGEFLQAVEEAAGIQTSILSETSEARLSAMGCLSVLPERDGTVVCFDLGGSSTEFLLTRSDHAEPLWSTSVFLGAATLTERFLKADPPGPAAAGDALGAVRSLLRGELREVPRLAGDSSDGAPSFHLVGTAGTVTTLAAMRLEMVRYEPYRINGIVLEESWVGEITDRLARMPLEARRGIPGLEKGREDIILGGALIVRAILDELGSPCVTVTDGGLLEGLLLELVKKEHGWPSTLISSLTWRLPRG